MPKYTKQLTNFTFSFSSVSTFKTCPWSFKLGYIDKVERQQNFFSNFGSFCHLILEKYFSNKLDIWELLDYYEKHYYEEVKELPPSFLSQLAVSYYDAGRKFFEEFDFDRTEYEILDVEEYVKGKDRKIKIVIKPDVILKKKDEDEITLMDFKSSEIFSKAGKLDEKKLSGYKKQINIYAYYLFLFKNIEISQAKLWFVRSNTFYSWKIDSTDVFDDVEWFVNAAKEIKKEEKWEAKPEKFFCNVLCSSKMACEYKAKM